MPDLRELKKGGWHPRSKDGSSKESWRGDFKGISQVAGWVGKGKDPGNGAGEHTSRPLSSLKDPASFGPPPKHINYHGDAAVPNHVIVFLMLQEYVLTNQTTPETSGLGAPLTPAEIRANKRAEEEEQRRIAEEEATPKPPPVPYRIDTTGLSTSHLPPPPGRKDGADGRPSVASTIVKPKPPVLPPRLPPRQNSSPITPNRGAPEPDAHKGILNQGSMNRLTAAGVSVPSLGIGGPPSASASSLQSPSPSQSPARNTSQLNELQTRFSRLSPNPSKPESPSEGTTLAQKGAAFKTASSFRNDPSSVSLADAKSAAGTANNFRERHGDQVKSGLQSANKFANKLGISDKIGSYRDSRPAQPSEASPASEARGNTARVSTLGKKKPPPPPPAKRAGLLSTAPGTPQDASPPPIPLSSKPKLQSSTAEPKDLDLDLNSLWFSKSPPEFPPASIRRLPGSRSYASSMGWTSSGVRKIHTFTGAIRDNNTLAATIIHLTWDSSNPGVTIKAQQRHVPPPRQLSPSDLENYRERYSDAVASWSESCMGQQVGNGECWTLANDALLAVGAGFSSRGQEACMSSQSYVHGYLIYSHDLAVSPYPQPQGGIRQAGVARGDILQLRSAHFKAKDGMREMWAGAPDHTAVVVGVEPDGTLNVVEQNVGGVKKVRDGSYDMSELVDGEVKVFRAVGESWVGKLEPKW